MSITLTALMKQRYDTAANWTAQNPTLLAGEFGIESDTKRWKVGTGATAWTSLLYSNGGTYPLVNADIAAGAAIAGSKIVAATTSVVGAVQLSDSISTTSSVLAATPTAVKAAYDLANAALPKAGGTMTGVLAVTAGTAALPGIAVSGDLNTGFWSPSADALAASTAGAERLRITSAGNVGIGTTSPAQLLHVSGSGTQAIRLENTLGTGNVTLELKLTGNTFTIGHNNSSIYFSDTAGREYIWYQGANERIRLDTSGRLLVGTSTARSNVARFGTDATPTTQFLTSTESWSTGLGLINYSPSGFAPVLTLGLSGSSTIGANTLVSSGHRLGVITFNGNDGTNFEEGVRIEAFVDGTPGANDMPGRLVFSITADGAASPTEALRITNDRVLAYNQPEPATYAAAATLTVADLKTGIITYTGANATLTLPTGTLTEGGFAGIYTNMAFEWSVINTGGAGNCTIGAGTAHTIVGSAIVTIGTSGRFASRRTAANTFVSYRLV